jgi:hypothetical protein
MPNALQNTEPPSPSAGSAISSLTQEERECLKAVQPGSPISSLLSPAHQPFMVAPAGGAIIRGEPTLVRELQAAKKEAARSLAHVNEAGGRLQEIAEESGLGDGLVETRSFLHSWPNVAASFDIERFLNTTDAEYSGKFQIFCRPYSGR